VNVQQKIPLTLDRENVPPAYLRQVRAAVLDAMHERMAPDDFASPWVTEATTDPSVSKDAISAMLDARYGKQRVVADPSDPEANHRAVAAGYGVIPGRALPKATWEAVRFHGLALPAGQVTPGHHEHFSPDGVPLREIEEEDYTTGMQKVVLWYEALGMVLLGKEITVIVVSDCNHKGAASYGSSRLILNKLRLGSSFFEAGVNEKVIALGLHELAHDRVDNHLSDEFHEECCRLGARLAVAVMQQRIGFNRVGTETAADRAWGREHLTGRKS
jgi:hypothetical protein